MVEGIEYVSNLVTRCAVLEHLYLRNTINSQTHLQLKEAIVKLNIAILRYLLAARRYFTRRTLSESVEFLLPDALLMWNSERLALATIQSAETAVQTYMNIIIKKAATVNASASLINAECMIFC